MNSGLGSTSPVLSLSLPVKALLGLDGREEGSPGLLVKHLSFGEGWAPTQPKFPGTLGNSGSCSFGLRQLGSCKLSFPWCTTPGRLLQHCPWKTLMSQMDQAGKGGNDEGACQGALVCMSALDGQMDGQGVKHTHTEEHEGETHWTCTLCL